MPPCSRASSAPARRTHPRRAEPATPGHLPFPSVIQERTMTTATATLEALHAGIRIAQGYVLPPNSEPEHIASASDRWRFGAFIAVLAHDIGKIVTDIEVVYRERGGESFAALQCPLFDGDARIDLAQSMSHPVLSHMQYRCTDARSSSTLDQLACAAGDCRTAHPAQSWRTIRSRRPSSWW